VASFLVNFHDGLEALRVIVLHKAKASRPRWFGHRCEHRERNMLDSAELLEVVSDVLLCDIHRQTSAEYLSLVLFF
jgi:hypothetical protein